MSRYLWRTTLGSPETLCASEAESFIRPFWFSVGTKRCPVAMISLVASTSRWRLASQDIDLCWENNKSKFDGLFSSPLNSRTISWPKKLPLTFPSESRCELWLIFFRKVVFDNKNSTLCGRTTQTTNGLWSSSFKADNDKTTFENEETCASEMTLSPFFGQFRGFLKVDRKPASRDHFIHFEGWKPF